MSTSDVCLDDILTEIGSTGKYQRRVLFYILIAALVAYFPAILWLFEAQELNYRCEISGCETDPVEYKPFWWTDAIPSVGSEPSKCERYKNVTKISREAKCDFDKDHIEFCDNYIYETNQSSILRDFNLHCTENLWKITLVGTINSAGIFVGLPISGILSDKFGRKTMIISSVMFSSIAGLILSFSNSYIFYTIMQFILSVCRAATYPICFVIGVEFVSPDKRVLVAVLVGIFYAIGGAVVGGVSWILQTWRTVDRILYSVCLLIGSYYWLIPESLRWMLAKGRNTDVENVLKKISKINGTSLSQQSLQKLWTSTSYINSANTNVLMELRKSRILQKRFILCSICWIFCIFSFQGLTVNSVALSGNNYLDFILTMLVEVPATFFTSLVVDRIGRRFTLALGCFICGLSCLSFIFIPEALYVSFGKFGSSIDVTVIYTLTSEMFPTILRSSSLLSCSMFGRIGAMIAPQMPLLELYWQPLPLTLFGGTSIIAGVFSFVFPETMNTVLPDTIEEAENIGKKSIETKSEKAIKLIKFKVLKLLYIVIQALQ